MAPRDHWLQLLHPDGLGGQASPCADAGNIRIEIAAATAARSAVGSADTRQTVLAKCREYARDKQGGPCFLYALNKQVVLSERRTQPE